MPMLDPLATFLTRVVAAGNDVAPADALFAGRTELSDDQRGMVEQLTDRARREGYVEDSGPDRIAVTEDGRQFLADSGL